MLILVLSCLFLLVFAVWCNPRMARNFLITKTVRKMSPDEDGWLEEKVGKKICNTLQKSGAKEQLETFLTCILSRRLMLHDGSYILNFPATNSTSARFLNPLLNGPEGDLF